MAHPQSAHLWQSQGHRRLAAAQVAAFCIGAFLFGIAAAGTSVPAVFILGLVAVAGSALLVFRKLRLSAILVPLMCLVGLFYYHSYFAVRAASVVIPFENEISFSGIITSEPGHSPKSEYFPLRLAPPFQGKIRIVAPPGSGFRYGDKLEIQGRVQAAQTKRDLPVAVFPQISLAGRGYGWPARQILSDFKRELLQVFPRYLPATEAAFLGGITLGAKANFSPQFAEALAASGTTHLVAISGYNISVLVFVVFGSCLHFLSRRAAFYLTTVALLAFVAMVGAEPSVVRAAGMGFVLLLARELGRPYGLPYALLWTAFFMVLWNPGALFMPGFQLSFMSLLGIVYLAPVILKRLKAPPEKSAEMELSPGFLGSFRENAALTIAAQLAVAPIALHNFGGIGTTSFMANALILPFMPLTMLFGFMLLACGLLLPPLGFLAGLVSHLLLAYEVAVINFFAGWPLPLAFNLPAWGTALYYFALIIAIRRHRLQEKI